MSSAKLSPGVAHAMPTDLRKALLGSAAAATVWEDITPLARNEWICWVESVKRQETREKHIQRAIADLTKGKRRPCCWMGCVHRTDKPMSSSQKFVLSKQANRRS